MDDLRFEQFVAFLRSALHHLYDPVQLRRSPLVKILALTTQFDQAAALQQTLTEAVRGLKPASDQPPQSIAWRIYDALDLLYIRRLDRVAVSNQLGISERQLRREQRVAIEALAQNLWRQATGTTHEIGGVSSGETDNQATYDILSRELGWLKPPGAEERSSLGATLDEVVNLALPLARQWQVALQNNLTNDLASLSVNRLSLRSLLVTLLGVAIPRAGQMPVTMTASLQDSTLRLLIKCLNPNAMQTSLSDKEIASLAAARELASFYGAALEFVQPEAHSFEVALMMHVPLQVPVLVIDDNADWIELAQRYVIGSRYQIIGVREPAVARTMVETIQPAIIVLDVMMHKVDGWQVLSELRQEPATSYVPIIICTVLPVEDIALSLEASAFLQKPVSQQQFLSILDRHTRLLD